MIRTLDAEPFNAIASDPEVRPWLGFADPKADIDLSPQVGNPDNFCFLTDKQDGGYIFLKVQQGLYAAHTLALPAARGRPMLRLMRHGLRILFTASDCIEVVTQVPDTNENAMAWSNLAGFRNTYRREANFPLMGEMVGSQYRSLDFVGWAQTDKENAILGQQFHAAIHGLGLADHPEDLIHDSMVGATLACAQNQNVVKGVALYNRWGSVAGYQNASVLSQTPPTVDTGDAIVSVLNGNVEVLKVRVDSAKRLSSS